MLGNRTSVVNGGTTSYNSNSLNQYTSVGGTGYSYDDNGNLTNDGTYLYYYDCENRLTEVNDINDSPVTSYAYDYLGRRVSKTQYAIPDTQYYAYGGDQVIAEYDGNDTLLRKFIYGPGIDEPICMIDVDGETETKYYYHFDGLGSVVALSDVNGVIVEEYSYDVFGEPNRTSDVNNPYLFTGRRLDLETNNYYYRARYYKPSIGRFLQTDPKGYYDSMNLYQYCLNNPLRWTDPYGMGVYDWIVNDDWFASEKRRHYRRNENNNLYPNQEQAEENCWVRQPDWKNKYHRYGPGNEENVKYLSPDGHQEAIYDKKRNIVTDPKNMGTYNYGTNRWDHFWKDMVPYYMWNAPPEENNESKKES